MKRAPFIGQELAATCDDIYGGQEVFCTVSSDILTKSLKDTHYVIANIGVGSIVNSGLFFASRFPVKLDEVRFARFNNLGGEDKLSDKGVLVVPVLVPFEDGDKKMIVCVTHFQAKYGPEYSTIRHNQALATLELIKNHYEQEACPIFLLGDFNVVDTEMDGSNPSEYTKLEPFFSSFHDFYLQDHDLSGKRSIGESKYLINTSNTTLTEPTSSFYHVYDSGVKERPGFRYDFCLLYDVNKKGKQLSSHTELRHWMERDFFLTDHRRLTTEVNAIEIFFHHTNLDSN